MTYAVARPGRRVRDVGARVAGEEGVMTTMANAGEVAVWGGIIAVILVVGGGWFVLSLIDLIGRGIGALIFGTGRQAPPPPPVLNGVRCAQAACQAVNPHHARFCRRCGKMVAPRGGGRGGGGHGRPVVRRVAMW